MCNIKESTYIKLLIVIYYYTEWILDFIFLIFSLKKKDQLLRKINAYKPPNQCQAINLIVIGNYRSGKSSLVNTFHTVLRNSDQISTITAAYGPTFGSITKKVGHKVSSWKLRTLHIYFGKENAVRKPYVSFLASRYAHYVWKCNYGFTRWSLALKIRGIKLKIEKVKSIF